MVARLTRAAWRRDGKSHKCARAKPLATAYPARNGSAAVMADRQANKNRDTVFLFLFCEKSPKKAAKQTGNPRADPIVTAESGRNCHPSSSPKASQRRGSRSPQRAC